MKKGLLSSLADIIMPIEDEAAEEQGHTRPPGVVSLDERRKRGWTASRSLPDRQRMMVVAPKSFEVVQQYAESIRQGIGVIVNLGRLDPASRQRLIDFMSGVCYYAGGCAEIVAGDVVTFFPPDVGVEKKTLISQPTGVLPRFGQVRWND
ncbi:MAG: cell division protein SepF [Negativicutes bacterium]|nr:cell division protein SepF [Negativicutes bacterium]